MGRLLDRVAPLYWPQQRLMYRSRRARLILRAELLARLVGSRIQTELARDVELGRRIAIDVQPGTRNRLTNGRSTSVGNDAVLRFQGGDLTVGSNTIIRSGLRLETSGRLTIGDGAYIGHGSFLHCASSTTIDDFVVLSEYATVTDSTHVRTSLDTSVLPNVRVSPTRIGRSAWLGAHVVVTAGVCVGDGAFVGANAVVTKDVPDGWLAVGNPAKPIRHLEVEELE